MALLKPTIEYLGVLSVVGSETAYDKRTTLNIDEEFEISINIPENSGADFYELVG